MTQIPSGPSLPRDALRRIRSGDGLDKRVFNALIDFVRSQGAPPGRHQFEDAGQVMTRGESGRVAKSQNWIRCQSDDASVQTFSIFEIYDATFDDDGPVFKVRKPEDGAELFGANEDFPIAGSQGWVKLVTPYEAVIARCSEDVSFLDDLSPDSDYGVESGSQFTAMTSRDSRDRVMLLGKVSGGNEEVTFRATGTPCPGIGNFCECAEAIVVDAVCGSSKKQGDIIYVWDRSGGDFLAIPPQRLERSLGIAKQFKNWAPDELNDYFGGGEGVFGACLWVVTHMFCTELQSDYDGSL